MGTKNNPQNRGKTSIKQKFNGKDVEPILIVYKSTKYMGGKYSKTTNIVCDDNGNPIPWEEIVG